MNINIVVLEIDKELILDIALCREFMTKNAKFYQEFNDEIILIFNEKIFLNDVDIYKFFNSEFQFSYSVKVLNSFAKSRLIYNFEKDYPELSLVVMSSGNESKFIKLKMIGAK